MVTYGDVWGQVGMAWADERDTTHFHELVKGCGLVVAVVGEVPTLLALLVQVYTY
jgi:hypothetical protein